MKKLIFILILTILATNVHADILKIPFSCYPRDLKREFKKKGLNIELDATYRDKNTDGFIRNNGNTYEIVTYRAVTIEDFKIIQEVTSKIARNNG